MHLPINAVHGFFEQALTLSPIDIARYLSLTVTVSVQPAVEHQFVAPLHATNAAPHLRLDGYQLVASKMGVAQ